MGNARDIVEQFQRMFAAGEIAESRALFDEECVTVMPGGALSRDEHEAMGLAFKAAFPDSVMGVDKAVESGDEVVVLGQFRGTHTGDLQSPNGTIPASGNRLDLRYMDYFKVENGKIVDHRTIFDQLDMLGQLGALPG